MELKNIEQVRQDIRGKVTAFSSALGVLHGDRLKSIYIYGSAIREDFIPGKSNINLLCVFKEINPPDLEKAASTVKKFQRKGIVPMFMTEHFLHTSSDIFPIEFTEMKLNNLHIYGESVLDAVEIHNTHLRLQCEARIRGTLLRSYQVTLESGFESRKLKALLITTFENLIPVFRVLLELTGKSYTFDKTKVIADVTQEFNLDKRVFDDIRLVKQGKAKDISLKKLWGGFLEELEKLGNIVDRWQENK